MRTDQEVFDIVWERLTAQGRPSERGYGGQCAYRAHDRKCAIGHLIPDEMYDPKMDQCDVFGRPAYGVTKLLETWPEIKEFTGDNIELLRELQHNHDSFFTSLNDFHMHMRATAERFGLRVPE